ncbi:MAG: Bug family tripartite tricarboxylate transporter substrate binding protein [Bacillota bacterium]
MFKSKKSLILLIVCLFVISTLIAACGQKVQSTPEQNNVVEKKDAYPSKPVQLIVPYGAGGAADLIGRAAASSIETYLGQPMIVSIKAGAAGAIGSKYVIDSKPDGYTLLLGAPGAQSIKPQVSDVGYGVNDLIPIAQLNADEILLAVKADSPIKNIEDFIKYAKENPGKVTVGNAGAGSLQHLAAEAFADSAGIKIKSIPFEGAGQATISVLGGKIDAQIGHPAQLVQNIKDGQIRALVVFEPERIEALKDVPTAKELGYDVELASWKTVFAPAGTPQEVVDKLREAHNKLIEDPTFKTLLGKMGATIKYIDGPKFQEYWKLEYKKMGTLIERLGLKDK